MPPVPPLSPVTVVLDRHDDALHTHTALAAHHPPSGRIPCTPARAPPARPASFTTFSPPWANRPYSRAAFPAAVSLPGKQPLPGWPPCP